MLANFNHIGMKTNELQEHRAKPLPNLEKELAVYEEKLVQLKFSLARGKVKNLREIREIKKSIAQLKTLIVVLKKKDRQNEIVK